MHVALAIVFSEVYLVRWADPEVVQCLVPAPLGAEVYGG